MRRFRRPNHGRWPQPQANVLPISCSLAFPPISHATLRIRIRSLSYRHPLCRLARPADRPHLPFLHQASGSSSFPSSLTSSLPSSSSKSNPATKILLQRTRPGGTGAGGIGGRFISTERKARWKAQLRWQLKFQAYFWPMALLAVIMAVGVQQMKAENDYPTPPEWSFWSRWHLRTARYIELSDEAKLQGIITDWARAGYNYEKLIERLEDTKCKDGTNVTVGPTPNRRIDVSMKSGPWRSGFYEALMGAGKTAEHLDGMSKRKGEEKGALIPWESIPGPSNPRPKPLPWDRNGTYENVPHEDEMENAYLDPGYFYATIIDGKGFDTRQRVEAALAYADWCEFKGLTASALDLNQIALRFAAQGAGQQDGQLVDLKTGVISKGKEKAISRNILKATTSLGVHYARNQDVKKALPIFLSILRTRRTIQMKPMELQEPYEATNPRERGMWPYVYALKNFVLDRPYPPLPSSGNETPSNSVQDSCEEIAIMAYIGEILFASSEKEREKGLSWTRDCVDAAEATLYALDERNLEGGKERCRECLETGIGNWKSMTNRMASIAVQNALEAENSNGWLGTGWGKSQKIKQAHEAVMRWKEEQGQVELRRQKTIPLISPLKPVAASWMSV